MCQLVVDVVDVGYFKDEVILGRATVAVDKKTLFLGLCQEAFFDLVPVNATSGAWRTSADGVAVLSLTIGNQEINGVPIQRLPERMFKQEPTIIVPTAPSAEQALRGLELASSDSASAAAVVVQGSAVQVSEREKTGVVAVQGSAVRGTEPATAVVAVQGSAVRGAEATTAVSRPLPSIDHHQEANSHHFMKGIHKFVVDFSMMRNPGWKHDVMISSILTTPFIPTLTFNSTTIQNFCVGFSIQDSMYPEVSFRILRLTR